MVYAPPPGPPGRAVLRPDETALIYVRLRISSVPVPSTKRFSSSRKMCT